MNITVVGASQRQLHDCTHNVTSSRPLLLLNKLVVTKAEQNKATINLLLSDIAKQNNTLQNDPAQSISVIRSNGGLSTTVETT